jgi:hypothetical protein
MRTGIEIRAAIAVRATAGCGLIVFPEAVVSAIGPPEATDGTTILAARVLGVRHLVEASVLALRPSHRVLLTGAAVDAIHAASMVGIALLSPTHRRPALLSATTAAGLAALGATLAAARRRSSH